MVLLFGVVEPSLSDGQFFSDLSQAALLERDELRMLVDLTRPAPRSRCSRLARPPLDQEAVSRYRRALAREPDDPVWPGLPGNESAPACAQSRSREMKATPGFECANL